MKQTRTIFILSLACVIVVASMIWHVSQLQRHLIESTALRTAELYTTTLTQFRTLYTSEVVGTASKHGLEVTHDYASRDNAIPLPATLSMILGDQIGKRFAGASSYLISPYPFPWREQEEKALQDRFYEHAWAHLSENPDKQYYEFLQQGNSPTLRYAIADVMRPECISCHNNHPDSPKTDWRAGDVRGILEVNLPLKSITLETSADLRKTIIAYAIVGLGIVIIIGMVISRLKRHANELAQRVKERTVDLESEIQQRRRAMDTLAEVEEKNRLVLNSAGEGIYGVDPDGNTIFVNPAVCKMLGYEESELLGQPMHELVHHSYPDGTPYPHMECLMYASIADDQVHNVTNEVLWHKNGSSIPVEYTSTPMHKDGAIVGAVIIFSDISERKKMEERFRLGIDASPAAMIMVAKDGNVIHVNHEAERLFGYPTGELLGKTIDTLVPDSKRPAHPSYREAFIKKPKARKMGGRDLYARKLNGDIFPVEVGLNPIDTPDGIVILCSVVDLTERKKYEETIIEQKALLEQTNKRLYLEATIDSLTSVANRRSLFVNLETFLQLARRNGQPVSVLMIDVDHFKKFNDDFGHPGGDVALQTVAQELDKLRRSADLVARYGGEEFAILLPETDQQGALAAGEKVRKAIEAITGLDRKITVSLGAATLVIDRDTPFNVENAIVNIIEDADKALYHSKETGRNRVTHFNDIAGDSRVVE